MQRFELKMIQRNIVADAPIPHMEVRKLSRADRLICKIAPQGLTQIASSANRGRTNGNPQFAPLVRGLPPLKPCTEK